MAEEIPATELAKIQKQAVDALESSPGQAAQIQATKAGVEEVIAGVGANQLFVRQIDADGNNTPQVYVVAGNQLIHVPNYATFGVLGGADPSKKTILLPHDAPIWQLPINGQQPGETA